MLVSFDPLMLLFWVFLACFLPGALLSLGIFRNSRLLVFEKVMAGFGLGIIILPLIPFLLYLLIGIKFSYGIALLSTALFYAGAAAVFLKSGAYRDFRLPDTQAVLTHQRAIMLLVLLIVLFSFIIRYVTYSPVFFELDPYYYTNVATQLLTLGENPWDDQTAWYPDVVVSHRTVPALSYLEAIWYSFYSSGAAYDNMLLAVIASMYPPILAALAVFFLYLFISAFYERDWGVLAAGIAAFSPIFVFKTLAGVMEVQPYAFFAIAFFLAMYALMLREKGRVYAILAGLGFGAIVLGSASEVVALTVLMLFIPLQSIYLYFREENLENFKSFLVNNGIVFAAGGILASMLAKGMFYYGAPALSYPLIFGMAIAFSAALYAIRLRLPDKAVQRNIFAGIVVAGLVLFLFSPLGSFIKDYAANAAGIGQYNQPLDRTIAEQKPASADLSSEMGFIAAAKLDPLGILLWLLSPFSFLVNTVLAVTVALANTALGTNLAFEEKANSLLMLFIFLFLAALAYSLYRMMKKEESYALFFAVLIFPPLVIGLLKAKYTIYAAFLMAAAIAFVFAESKRFLDPLIKNTDLQRIAYMALVAFAGIILVCQFAFSAGGFAPAILSQSGKARFQDNPSAFSEKFTSICNSLASKGYTEESLCQQYAQIGRPICTEYDEGICTVAADPLAYAQKGTNEQYSTKLCYYSLIADITSPTSEEITSADLRCRSLSGYWIEAMEWISANTAEGARFTSWWDYGHWINYFGERNTVLRNEHASHFMIGEVAHAYLAGTPEELAAFMKSRDSRYAIFDMELLSGGGSLGGKYGALNYLQCARNNKTGVQSETGASACEAQYLWETVIVPSDPTGQVCVISKTGNKSGVLAYRAYWSTGAGDPYKYTPNYPETIFGLGCYGQWLNNPRYLSICQSVFRTDKAYCIGEAMLSNGQMGYGAYLLNETYPNGDLRLNKAIFAYLKTYPQTAHLGDAMTVTLLYTKDPIFLENGVAVHGYDDTAWPFYKSNLYRAMFLDELPGFTKVFESKDGLVRIFRLVD